MSTPDQMDSMGGPLGAAFPGFAPGPVFRLFGMRRSGNHAISSWICRNAPAGRAVFFNNCEPGKPLEQGINGLEIDGRRCPDTGAEAALAEVEDGALLLCSYEDVPPGRTRRGREAPLDPVFAGGKTDIIVYRSPLHWAASLLRKLQRNQDLQPIRRSIMMLRAFEIYADLLDSVAGENVIPICYDCWVSTPEARLSVLEQLGLQLRDNGLGPVQAYGGGSSFQPDERKATALQVLERWQAMQEDPEFLALVTLISSDPGLMARIATFFPQDHEILMRLRPEDPA